MSEKAYDDWLKANGFSLDEDIAQPVEPLPTTTYSAPETQAELDPEIEESKRILEEELSKQDTVSNTILDVAKRTGIEIGSGMTMQHILSRSLPYIKTTLQTTRAASLAGFAGPQALEPVSTGIGLAAFALSEFGIWALANYFGQRSMGDVNGDGEVDFGDISGAELVSSGVFGMGFITKGAEGLLRLNIASNASWKGGNVLINGTKTAVSGAVIGVAESALRQEIEARINDKERDEWDYLFSGVFGAAANVGLNSIANALKGSRWGRSQLKDIVDSSVARLEKENESLKQQIKDLEKFPAKSNRVIAQQQKKIADLEQQIENNSQAIEINKEIAKKAGDADTIQTEIEEGEPQVVDIEPEIQKADEEIKEVLEDLKKETEPEAELVDEPVVEEPTPVAEEPTVEAEEVAQPPAKEVPEEKDVVLEEAPKRQRHVDDEREDLLDQLTQQFQSLGAGETLKRPLLEKAINALNVKTTGLLQQKIEKLSDLFVKGDADVDLDTVQEALNEVRFLQGLNELKHPLDTEWGRAGQAKSRKADTYKYEAELSETSIKERQRLSMLEDALVQQLEGPMDDDIFNDLFQGYLEIRPSNKGRAAQRRKAFQKKRDEAEKFDADNDAPDKILKAIRRKKDRLTNRLNSLRNSFGNLDEARGHSQDNTVYDSEINELEEKIKFYELAERDAIELEKGLAEEARLAELQTAPLGEQRAEITPKPTGPKRPESTAAQQKKKNAMLRQMIKDRISEIDKAALELDPDFQAAKAEKQLNNKINILQQRLDELRAEFGDDVELDAEGKPVKPKHPKIKDYEDRIRYYQQARDEIIQIKKKEAERDEWIRLQTAPLGEQREAVTPKPTGPKKPEGYLEKLNKDIAFLKSNARNRVKEIDKARKDLDPEEQARRLLKQQEAQLNRLENELEQQRELYLQFENIEAQVSKKKKRDPKRTQAIKDKEDQIKFYKDAIAQTRKLLQLEKEIAKLSDVAGRAVVGEMRAAVTPTPKGPVKITALQRKMAERSAIKAYIRKAVADIDKARAKQIKEDRDLQIFDFYVEWFMSHNQRNKLSKIGRVADAALEARRMLLLDQLPSVLAGIPGGAIEWVKLLALKPFSNFIYNMFRYRSLSTAKELMSIDFITGIKFLSELNTLGKAIKSTFKEGISATDAQRGRIGEDFIKTQGTGNVPTIVQKAKIKAQKKARADAMLEEQLKTIMKGNLMHLGHLTVRGASLGVRGIGAMDELLRRPYIQYRLMNSALKSAHLDYKNGKIKKSEVDEHAKKLYDSFWTQDGGIPVLNEIGKINEEVRQANDVFYFSSDTDDLGTTYTRFVDIMTSEINKVLNNYSNPITWGIKFFVPFVSMTTRSAYRMTKLGPGLPFIPVRMAFFNPYTDKLNIIQKDIRAHRDALTSKVLDEDTRAKTLQLMNDKISEAEIIKERRHVYNQELLADTFLGLAITGVIVSKVMDGEGTGSLAWMNTDQREKQGMKPFRIGGGEEEEGSGVDYSSWAGPAGTLAFYADIAQWSVLKATQSATKQQILTEDQDLITVIKSSMLSVLKEQPFTSGIKSVEELATAKGDQLIDVLAKQAASLGMMPAQARKIIQRIWAGEKAVDLRGGTFAERVMWNWIGTGPNNFKSNIFGDFETSQATWGSAITRMLPKPATVVTEDIPADLRKVIASDGLTKQLPNRLPATITSNVTMVDWRNDDGLHLETVFAERLKNYTDRDTGVTIKEAVLYLIRDDENWEEDYSKQVYDDNTMTYTNAGLNRLSKLINDYYRNVKLEILEDEGLLQTFVNKDDENLLDAVNREKQIQFLEQKPISPVEALRIVPGRGELLDLDLMDLLKENPQMQLSD